ncbi:hypothetical protein BCR33DRAFT_714494 [Rhizoclosmatium globosum]|uniref:ZZ-type domain-containing protein n=1 Tax=Rhizoclosmatium globosum TaxID=329046 RepID=A0A1Y2CMG3_9FUNG|nr:hypothetical protein BCR33DRAFT_714494 [Rhizoclosmatium globosum]|eukprot:ORY48044.1 hypothetical protein BCR33DRAFT_714494 [Rhizoclosmatium globosum]
MPALVLNAITDELRPFPVHVASAATQPTVSIQPGDDPTPPNGVSQANLNGISVVLAASAGFSTAPSMQDFHPSKIHFDLDISISALTVSTIFEFENPYYATHSDGKTESMVVKAKVAKFIAVPDSNKDLQLVSTRFQDWDGKEWVDITTSIAYTAQAKAVVDAVIQTQSNQTAGMATVQDESFDVTLGPVGMKGRILLTFTCGAPFVYDAMGLALDGSDIGKGRLIPVSLFLPWASLKDQNGDCGVSFAMKAPASSIALPPSDCGDAYRHLHGQELLRRSTMIAVDSLKQEPSHSTAQHTWSCLPISPTFVIFWLLVPNDADFGFEILSLEEPVPKETELKVTVLQPSAKDSKLLMQSLPGAGYNPAQLARIIIDAPKKAFPRTKPQLILNIGLSDASGSTCCSSGTTTVRAQFNEMTKRRFLKRVFSIPVLLESGILQPHDVWTDVVIAFDGSAREQRVIAFRVSDFNATNLSQDPSTGNVKLSPSALFSNDKVAKDIVDFVHWSESITPGGFTDFVKPAEKATSMIQGIISVAQQLTPGLETTSIKSFVDFDTDGGHNGTSGDVTTAINALVQAAQVRNGVVTGFGSWVDQTIASKVAALLGPNPALLGLHVPQFGHEGMDRIFATGFTAWVDTLRHESFELSVTAGSFSENTDAVQVLFAKGQETSRIDFGAVDVSNVNYTGSVLTGVSSGDSLILYATSRLDAKTLAQRIEVKINGVNQSSVHRSVKPEMLEGANLAFEWLAVTGQKDSAAKLNSSVAVPNLLARIEDNVSFAYNMPTLTGTTAYLGRAENSGNRTPIDKAHQPQEPSLARNLKPILGTSPLFGTSTFSAGAPGGLFGTQSAPIVGAVNGFGASSLTDFGKPPTAAFGTNPAASSFSFGSGAVPSSGALAAFGFSAPPQQQQMHQQLQQQQMQQAQMQQQLLQQRLQQLSQQQNQQSLPQHPLLQQARKSTLQQINPKKHWAGILNRSSNLKVTATGAALQGIDQTIEQPGETLTSVQYTIQKFIGTVAVNYVCDTCNRQIDGGQIRFHCLDCYDFDECEMCHGRHVSTMAFHRVVAVNNLPPSYSIPRDPLLDKLLGVARSKLETGAANPSFDVTVWSQTRVIKRLLVAMVEWWVEIRAWLQPSELPEVLDSGFLCEVQSALASKANKQILEVGLKIVDTLIREYSK